MRRPRSASHAGLVRLVRHGFGDDGFGDPVKFHAGLTAAHEEIGVATAEKIEAQVEGGIGEPCKHRRAIRQLPQP